MEGSTEPDGKPHAAPRGELAVFARSGIGRAEVVVPGPLTLGMDIEMTNDARYVGILRRSIGSQFS